MAQIVTITNPLTGQPAQVDQLDHTAQQIDDGLNIARGVSNPNLLDNWYFGNPVNQRGKTSYSANGYTIDRWRTDHNTSYGTLTVDKTTGCVTLSHADDGGFVDFVQYLENPPTEIVTLSVLMLSGDLYSATGTLGNISLYTDEIYIRSNSPNIVAIRCNTGKTISMIAAKLELGSQQTLAHQDNGVWVLNEIPDYGEQLARCQRYQLVIGDATNHTAVGIGVGRTTNDVFTSIPTPVTMRTIPTATIQGVVSARCNGVHLEATGTGEIIHSPGTINLAFNVSAVQSGAPYDVFLTPGSKLILDSNL